MAIEPTPARRLLRSGRQRIWIGVLVLSLAALMVGAASLPFLFESQSIYYKFGWDKVMLRTGKVIGLTAALLLLLQLPLAGRFRFLDRIFSLPGLYRIHRYVGYLIVLLVAVHPVLVYLPEGRWMIPMEARYWPEWVGAGLLVTIVCQVAVARWRMNLVKHYPTWLFVHRLVAMMILSALVVHVLNVSETFQVDGLPRNAVFTAAAVAVILWLGIRAQRLRARRHAFAVSRILPAGRDAYTIELAPAGDFGFRYTPGQFAFFSFQSDRISAEWHPFTLSSSPTRPDGLQVNIRTSGDWTRNIHRLQAGTRVYVHGPFGRFSHRFEAGNRPVVMIAGGIGITPMLSMLRQMRDTGDQRPILLIWSNQTAAHLFFREELDAYLQELTHFRWIPIFTRNREPLVEFGMLNRDTLRRLLAEGPAGAVVFLCGPPKMIQDVQKDLIAIGFSASSIKTELFGL